MPPSPALSVLEILQRVQRGELAAEAAAQRLAEASAASSISDMARVDGATVDIGRQERCGFGEVIYGEGKSAELVVAIAKEQLARGQRALVTRVNSEAAHHIVAQLPTARFCRLARTVRIDAESTQSPRPLAEDELSRPHVAVVTAGSTDAAVAAEAIETLDWMQIGYQRFEDIGVAGPQRLAAAVPRLRKASVVIVIAGMEGALPAAVAGHLAVPIIAVPTSVGYGANLGGITTMLGMACSCAASVAVVNIDAGFKGGYIAGMIVRQLQRAIQGEANR